MTSKKSIAKWEKGENIHKQRVIPLGRGLYLHAEIVSYDKKKTKTRRRKTTHRRIRR